MGDPGHDDLVEIAYDVFERFGLLGSRFGQQGTDVTGLGVWRDRSLAYRLQVVGDPVDEIVPVPTELVEGQVVRRLRRRVMSRES